MNNNDNFKISYSKINNNEIEDIKKNKTIK